MAGIYLHIPFCKQACNYCNFHFATTMQQKDNMLLAIKKEMALQQAYLQHEDVKTVYFGGGTPSVLSVDELLYLWHELERNFAPNSLDEVTLEANPDNLTKTYLKALKQSPINRLSIGIQSFHDTDLKFMNRAHTASEAEYAVKAAQDAGFEEISIDLIYGTPTMSDIAWKQNIQMALGLGVPHISAYALTVEPQTQLAHAIKKGQAQAPIDSKTAHQFDTLVQMLTDFGFHHYEISNFALPNRYAKHNTNYWRGVSYLGLGPSAHSFNGSSRQWNVANNAMFIKSILNENKLTFEQELLRFEDRVNEYIMTSLRTMWGVSEQYIATTFGAEVVQHLQEATNDYLEKGLMRKENGFYILNHSGKFMADGIAADLFLDV